MVTLVRINFDRTESDERRHHEREQQDARLRHERAEQWRDRLVRAADDFSTGVEQALLAVNEAISAVVNRGDREGTVAEARRVIGEAVARVGRVKLLFGEDSRPAAIGRDLLPTLRLALSHVEVSGADVHGHIDDAWQTLEKCYAGHQDFNRAALEMIR